jgi:succinate dehydrogenase / fumarate reductase flavoprotein subunit
MSNLPGLFALGEASFSDHGANRLGANSLLQCLTDGYLIAPYAVGHYLASARPGLLSTDTPEFRAALAAAEERIAGLLAMDGERTPDSLHRELGRLLWDECGIIRNEGGLRRALEKIPVLREEFRHNTRVPGRGSTLNATLEQAGRVADFLELAELLCLDALARDESCGCHFREEHQTEDQEARRNDEEFAHIAAWEHRGAGETPALHREPLTFAAVTPSRRDYKR